MGGERSRLFGFNQRGFTLLELMLVMAILGVLATIGFTAFKENQKHAADAQAVSLLRNILTYAAVDEPTGEQDSTENKPDLTQAGYPEVSVLGDVEFIISNSAEDMWQFWFAHPGGITGYYFWVPGENCSRTDDHGDGTGVPADTIEVDVAYRTPLGL